MKWKEHFEVGKQSTYHVSITLSYIISGIFMARTLGPEGLGSVALIQAFCFLTMPLINLPSGLNLLREIKDPNNNPWQWVVASNKLTNKIGIATLFLLGLIYIISNLVGQLELQLQPQSELNLTLCCIALVIFGQTIEKKATSTMMLNKELHRKLKRDTIATYIGSVAKILACFGPTQTAIILGLFGAQTLEAIIKRISNKNFEASKQNQETWLHYPTQKIKGTNTNSPKNTNNTGNLNNLNNLNNHYYVSKAITEKSSILLKEGLKLVPIDFFKEATETIKRLSLAHFGSHANPQESKKTLGDYAVSQRQSVGLTIMGQVLYEKYKGAAPLKPVLTYTAFASLITLASIPLIPIIYGKEFYSSMNAALMLLIPNALSILAQCRLAILISEKKSMLATKINIISMSLIMLTSFLIGPKLGILGIAIAMTLGLSTQILLSFVLTQKEFKLKINQNDP